MANGSMISVLIGAALMIGGCDSGKPQPQSDEPPGNGAPQPPAQAPAAPEPAPPAPSDPMPEYQPAQPPQSSSLPRIDSGQYAGPAFSVLVVQAKRLPPISTAMVEVTVPTGGWTLRLDQTEVVGDTAKIFMTLERPEDGELVTQSMVTHKDQFTSEKPPFTNAEVYVHLAQRGIHTLTTNYRLAAKN